MKKTKADIELEELIVERDKLSIGFRDIENKLDIVKEKIKKIEADKSKKSIIGGLESFGFKAAGSHPWRKFVHSNGLILESYCDSYTKNFSIDLESFFGYVSCRVPVKPDTHAIDVIKAIRVNLKNALEKRKEEYEREIEDLRRKCNETVRLLDMHLRQVDEITANFDLVSDIHEK